MTTALPTVDEDIAALDFAPRLSCEFRCWPDRHLCGALATWLLRCRQCERMDPVCDQHRFEQLLIAAVAINVRCPHCGVTVPGGTWSTSFDFIPIGAQC